MEVIWQPGFEATPGNCYFSPALLSNSTEHTKAYYDWVVGGLEIIVSHQKDADPFAVKALAELKMLCPKEEQL
jgi:hypothetical protein